MGIVCEPNVNKPSPPSCSVAIEALRNSLSIQGSKWFIDLLYSNGSTKSGDVSGHKIPSQRFI